MIWLLLFGFLLLLSIPWLLFKRVDRRHRKREQTRRKNISLDGSGNSIDRILRTYSVKSRSTQAPVVDDREQLQPAVPTARKSELVGLDERERLRQPEPTSPAKSQQLQPVRKLPPPEYHWLKKNHRLNIQAARLELKQLRAYTFAADPEEVLKIVIGTLRRTKPFVFEEMLLHCFKEQGWQVIRNERYTGDDGIDGRIYSDGKLYFVQAKRYSGHIQAAHLREFEAVIQEKAATGGFFVHSGRTGDESKGVLRQPGSKVILLSGMGVVDLVLGRGGQSP
jgi:restriction system protein